MWMRFVYACIMILGMASAAWAQQTLTPAQQCYNHQQELVLADIAYQEARSRCANIVRQAYELEAKLKALTDQLEKEKAAHKVTKDELEKLKEARDATKATE